MKNKELKSYLKNAYRVPETMREKEFVRRYEKRTLQLFNVIKRELRYMCVGNFLAGLALGLLLWAVTKTEDMGYMWIVSSMIPLCAMVPTFFLTRSERYGMDELEAASRFSLRLVRLVRLYLTGIFSAALILVISLVLKSTLRLTSMQYIVSVVAPFLLSDFGSMLVARKWHKRENIFGIAVVCLASGILPLGIRALQTANGFSDINVALLALTLFAAVVREYIMYIKESERISWNLC